MVENESQRILPNASPSAVKQNQRSFNPPHPSHGDVITKSDLNPLSPTYIGKLLLELDDGPELGLGVGAVGAEELGDVDHVVVVGGQVLLGLEVQEVVPAGQTQLHLV